jgi:hypothetical protein
MMHHLGHNCLHGGRGSWADEGSASAVKINAFKIIQTLTDSKSSYARQNKPLPSSRTAVFSAHSKLKEEERLAFWEVGSIVTDDHKHLITWTTGMPSWEDSNNANLNADEDDKVGVLEHKDGDHHQNEMPAPIQLSKQSSSTTDKLNICELRAELEELESQKDLYSNEEDSIRKELIAGAAVKHKLLEDSVNSRLEELTVAYNEFTRLVKLSLKEGESTTDVGDVFQFEETRKCYVGPHSGRESAYALAWLEVYKEVIEASGADIDSNMKALLRKHYTNVNCELSFLKQLALAAKVVAHVTSPIHKKSLNLCHNWLDTFLPHCLAKINRVSFGLLSAEDCKATLATDPRVPRSRLKLAVPFVGKDVPSKSSEFAHPDVIIGLTVLAYRYNHIVVFSVLFVISFMICVDIQD